LGASSCDVTATVPGQRHVNGGKWPHQPLQGNRDDGTFRGDEHTSSKAESAEIARLVPIVGETSKYFCGDFPFKIKSVTF
jgi:hypothetical protein